MHKLTTHLIKSALNVLGCVNGQFRLINSSFSPFLPNIKKLKGNIGCEFCVGVNNCHSD